MLVESGVDANILGSHLLLGELADLLDGTRSTLLVTHTVDQLGQVDCALPSHHLVDGGLVTLLLLGLGHFRRRVVATNTPREENHKLIPLFQSECCFPNHNPNVFFSSTHKTSDIETKCQHSSLCTRFPSQTTRAKDQIRSASQDESRGLRDPFHFGSFDGELGQMIEDFGEIVPGAHLSKSTLRWKRI